MPKLFFSKNKKSAIEISLIHLLEIILAIGVVVFLIYFSLKLSGFFIGRQEYDATINNLEALETRIKEIVKDTKDTSQRTTIYSISENYILVGFSYDDKGTIRTECTQENIVSSRPKSCQSKSCLCIYQNFGGPLDLAGKDFDSKGEVTPIKCKSFDEKVVFLVPALEQQHSNLKGSKSQWQPAGQTSYSSLVLYGQCKTGKNWGVRQISLEKRKEGSDILLFVKDISNKETPPEEGDDYLRI